MSLSLLRGDLGSSPSAPHRAPRAPVVDTENAIDASVRAADLDLSDVLPADVSSRDVARVDAATDVPAPLSTMLTRKPARPVRDSTEACSTPPSASGTSIVTPARTPAARLMPTGSKRLASRTTTTAREVRRNGRGATGRLTRKY